MIPLTLSIALVLLVVLDMTVGTVRTRRALATFEATPANRVRYYRIFIVSGWARAAAATLVTFTAGLSLSGIGLSAAGGGPTGGARYGWLLAWLLAAYLIFGYGFGAVRVRYSMRAGQVYPQRARTAALIPRTTRERWYAAAMAVTAGIAEEIFFRGALIALGIEVFHLPAPAAAAVSLVLFTGIHAHQGRPGLLNSGFIGFCLTFLTLQAGSLLPAMVVHTMVNVWALLVVPAEPTAVPADGTAVAAHRGAVEQAAVLVDTAPAAGVPAIRPPIPAG
ncbi:CPBP family intramembrane glutamic endopeptidase [Actinoplanes regularis]|uniref:CPBP family intramembrane glutamic endopeptidase n=1 Tax=Actinoplanes regularis TaxID=52697 RepID=UPI0024A277BD|nr:CPBP family intramembrane glutamic endopeptidase [Actinoplanes regularis]GLW30442.1 hypothetical protein Areg01_33820 [Actinoplanes regularis]